MTQYNWQQRECENVLIGECENSSMREYVNLKNTGVAP